jgi:cytochrome c2
VKVRGPGPRLLLALALLAALGACGQRSTPASPEVRAERARGRALLVAYGCVACHRIEGLATPQGQAGPPLGHVAGNSYIGGILPNTPDAMAHWIMHPRQVSPGTAMPDLGVNAADARAMVAYLNSQ